MTGAGERLPVAHPLLKAFLVVLASAYPQALAYDTALAHALALAREYGYRGRRTRSFSKPCWISPRCRACACMWAFPQA